MSPPTIISYGGGVQSTALIVLAVTDRLAAIGYNVDAAVMSNVGDDSEDPETLVYVREVMVPWAAAHGFEVIETHRVNLRGAHKGPETLWGRLMRPESKSLPIPVRMADTGAPGTRSCTADFKIVPVGRWLKAHGATDAEPGIVLIGISTDEYQRANNKRAQSYEVPAYPLLELGLSRGDCEQIIRDAGLPVPPKSSCFFCPFHRPQAWAEQRRDKPELFAKSQLLEDTLNDRRRALPCPTSGEAALELVEVHTGDIAGEAEHLDEFGEPVDLGREYVERHIEPGTPAKCPRCKTTYRIDAAGRWPDHHKSLVYLTRFGRRLEDAIAAAQTELSFDGSFNDGACDEGYCWT